MKKIFFNFLKGLVALLGVGAVVYISGPRPAKPVYPAFNNPPAASLAQLETELAASEAAEPGIKPGCEAKIVWADTSRKEKTPVAMLYLHGFGASREEGAPVHGNLAKTFGCNLFLARMDEHGVEEGEGNMAELTADSYVESAERALSVARQLGDSVVVVATSAGGALALFLASRHPEIKALVVWSPCIRLYSGLSGVMAGPWGLKIAQKVQGKNHNDYPFKRPVMANYWTNHQRLEGIVQFAVFLETAMVPATFAKIKCPVFVGYYYKDEEHQDKLVSVAAMRSMLAELGTEASKKREVAFPEAGDHVIASRIVSQDWQGVERASAVFLMEVAGMKEADRSK
jgi:pimeloyl-ACP methyl ester carboxylesterase